MVPFEAKMFPDVPGDTVCTAEVPFPSNTVLAVNEELPVPPPDTGSVPVVNTLVDDA